MKYPVIYIKGRGNHTARFTELTEGQMRIAGDIGAAMGKLMPLKDDHAFILYEQQGEEDIRSIRFLRSWFPGAGIILIISGQLTGEERRAYLGAGVNSAVPDDISRADFLRILQFMTDYTFVHKPVAGSGNDVELFRMPLWKRAFDIAASLSAILLLSPLLIAVAVAVRLDSPGPVIYKSKRVGSNYRIFDFLKFRSMHSDADQRLKELEDLNQYASEPVAEDDAKMALNDDEIRKLLADTENGMLYADDFVIPEEAHQHQLETEQENAFVKIENDPRITRLGRFLRKYSIDELPRSSTSCGATCRSWATARCPSTRPNASRATNISNGSCAPRASRDCGRSKNAGRRGNSRPNSASSSTSNTPAGCRRGST